MAKGWEEFVGGSKFKSQWGQHLSKNKITYTIHYMTLEKHIECFMEFTFVTYTVLGSISSSGCLNVPANTQVNKFLAPLTS